MRIGIDGRIIMKRGVGRYIYNLVKNLLLIDKKNQYVLYTDNNSPECGLKARNLLIRKLRTGNAFVFREVLLKKAAREDNIDILHSTDNSMPCVLGCFKGRNIVTIHDTMYVRAIAGSIAKPTLKQIITDSYNKFAIPESAKKAGCVITVSAFSKKCILKETKAKNVSVIYEAAEEGKRKTDKGALKKYGIKTPYVLISGASDKRKNAPDAIDAFAVFNAKAGGIYSLVITSIGSKELRTTEIENRIRKNNLKDRAVITGYVSDEEMNALYKGAFCFFFPSLWEGFGLQVLEAFTSGTPVITSNCGSLPEVAGNAALLCDPNSFYDMSEKLLMLHNDKKLRAKLVASGKKQAKKFSWKRTAEETLKIYEKVSRGII